MLLGSVAHAGGYKKMVGTYNTVGRHCRVPDACGRLCCLLQKWQMSVPANTVRCLEACEEFSPRSLGMVKPDAHNTIDAQRHVGGFTVWKLTAPTIL